MDNDLQHKEQDAPIPNENPAVWDLVIADMKARDAIGRRRYGTPLQAFNGRNALRDAYEEALDQTVYLRQAMEEQPRVVIEGPVSINLKERLGLAHALLCAYGSMRGSREAEKYEAQAIVNQLYDAADEGVALAKEQNEAIEHMRSTIKLLARLTLPDGTACYCGNGDGAHAPLCRRARLDLGQAP